MINDDLDLLDIKDNLDSLLKDIDLTPNFSSKTVGLLLAAATQLRKSFSHKQVIKILKWINTNLMESPLSNQDFYDFCHNFNKYIEIDIDLLSKKILEYLKIVESANIWDIKDYCKEDRKPVMEAIEKLMDEKWLVKHRKEYRIIKKLDWKDTMGNLGERLAFEVPYFGTRAYFCHSDIILVGAKTGSGKTHVAMNMILDFVRQGIKPYYISTESGSRHARIARDLGLRDGQYFHADVVSAEDIELEPNAVTIIDWLLPKDHSETDKLFQFFANKMSEVGGLLIIFMQLKDFSGEWFAPNMCKLFPSFAARFVLNEDRDSGKFEIDKIREAKDKDSYKDINCSYNWHDKTLIVIDDDSIVKDIVNGFEGTIK
ncbi:MAG: ATP-binding protein [Candidatus Heimdallarchaeaceae archaeon]